MAWYGTEWPGVVRSGEAGKARLGEMRYGGARRVEAGTARWALVCLVPECFGKAGKVGRGMLGRGTAGCDKVRQARRGGDWYGVSR